MPCPVSAGAAETADGAVERMVLLGLTGAYYTKFRDNEITVRTKSNLPRGRRCMSPWPWRAAPVRRQNLNSTCQRKKKAGLLLS